MTPERLKQIKSVLYEGAPLLSNEAWECYHEIERLQAELTHTRNNAELLHEDSRRLAKVVGQLEIELAALKTPPRCPKCGSQDVVPYHAEGKWVISCYPCTEEQSGFNTVIEALNAWRKV